MKKLIVLGGNSEKNQMWGAEVGAKFGAHFDEVYVQHYDHWDTGEDLIAFPREIEKLRDVVAGDELDTTYVLFAKSYGTLLAFMAIHERVIEPEKCVFFGIPLDSAEKHELFAGDWSIVSEYSIPTLAFHYEDDPVADYAFTRDKLTELGVASIELVSLPGDTHRYDAFDDYAERIESFMHS